MEPDQNKRLDQIPKKDIFNAPDGYFDGLEAKINQRIEQLPAGRTVSFYQSHRWQLVGLAAAAAITLLIVFLPGIKSDRQDVNALLAEISADDCLAYLEMSELPIDDLLQNTTADDIDAVFGDYLMPVPEASEEELDELLYEKFGATSDEKLKSL